MRAHVHRRIRASRTSGSIPHVDKNTSGYFVGAVQPNLPSRIAIAELKTRTQIKTVKEKGGHSREWPRATD